MKAIGRDRPTIGVLELQSQTCIEEHPPAAGGYFFGTVPDGKRVLAALNRQRQLDSPMLSLSAQTFCEDAGCARQRRQPTDKCAAHGQAAPAPFGSAYTCAIGDTVTAGGSPRLAAARSDGCAACFSL